MNVVHLKHGKLDVKLLICSKSWRNTVIALEDEKIVPNKPGAASDAMFRYAYHSYVAYCKKNLQTPEYDEWDFDELLTDQKEVETADSNIEAVLTELSNYIISKIEAAAGETKDEKKSQQTTN